MNNDHKLTDIQEQYNLLSKLEQQFREELALTPCIGAEIEFYIHGNVNIDLLAQKIGRTIKEEKGKNQYEVDLLPSGNLALYAREITDLRHLIIKSTVELGGNADFNSKHGLKQHMENVHKNKKSFTCSFCDSSYSLKGYRRACETNVGMILPMIWNVE